MQFAVPQFIESEARIFAFLTVRQFVIILITSGLVVVIVASSLSLILMFSLSMLVIGLGVSLAFVKINGHLFHEFFGFMFNYLGKSSVRVWQKKEITQEDIFKREKLKNKKEPESAITGLKRPLNKNSLSKLSLIVDTGGSYQNDNLS